MKDGRTTVNTAKRNPSGSIQQQSFSLAVDYPVIFSSDVFSPDNPTLRKVINRLECDKQHRLIAFVDQGVSQAWPDLTRAMHCYAKAHRQVMSWVCDPILIPGGENCKNDISILHDIYSSLDVYHIDRQSFVIAIGGGAVLDLVGYAAATAHRGIRLIRLPTTVLSQNDSGVGVKTAINLLGKKNFVGTFSAPFAVVNDSAFLSTLSSRDRRAGLAEAIKVALIRDHIFFEWMEENARLLADFDDIAEEHMIRQSAKLHMQQIAKGGDPFEMGSIRPLDHGHWAAHKLEALSGYELRHGEAVSIGIALDTRYSVAAGLLSEAAAERILRMLSLFRLPIWHPELIARDLRGNWPLLNGLEEFREHLGGQLTITLLKDIGCGTEVHQMDAGLILDAANWLSMYHTDFLNEASQ